MPSAAGRAVDCGRFGQRCRRQKVYRLDDRPGVLRPLGHRRRRAGLANAKALEGLPDAAFNKAVLGDPAKVAKVQFMRPLADELRQQMLELWQETKTYMQQ